MLILGLQLFLTYFMVKFAMRKDTHPGMRALTFAIAIGQFLIPWGWTVGVLYGAFCWADVKMKYSGHGL
jgi:hypothetical protein